MPLLPLTSASRRQVLRKLRNVACGSAVQELPGARPARSKILCELWHICVIISVGLEGLKLMRLRACSIVGLVLLATGTLNFNAGVSKAHGSTIQSNNTPRIFNVRVKGKKLFLTGENFTEGAVILVNGEPQKTRNDEESPSTTLIAKRAGNSIPDDSAVNIQVQSANGLSDKFPFFKGQVITLDDAGRPINLQVGGRFLLFLQNKGYEFTPMVLDETILRKVTDVEIPGSQGVFEALRTGNTKLTAIGELPCHKAHPACLAPTLAVEFTVIVE